MEIKIWLRQYIADEIGQAMDKVDCDQKFDDFGLDSLSTISIIFDMEKEFGLPELDPTVFDEYNTINKLSAWLETLKK